MKIDFIKSYFDDLVRKEYFGKELFFTPLKEQKKNHKNLAPQNNYNQISKLGFSLSPNKSPFFTKDNHINNDCMKPAATFIKKVKKIKNPYKKIKNEKKNPENNEKLYSTKNSEINLLNLELENLPQEARKKMTFEVKLKQKLNDKANEIKLNHNLNNNSKLSKKNNSCEIVDLNEEIYFPSIIKTKNSDKPNKGSWIKNMSFNKKISEWKNLKEKGKVDFYSGKVLSVNKLKNKKF